MESNSFNRNGKLVFIFTCILTLTWINWNCVSGPKSFVTYLFISSITFLFVQLLWFNLMVEKDKVFPENAGKALNIIASFTTALFSYAITAVLLNIPFPIAGKIFSLFYLFATYSAMITSAHFSSRKKTNLLDLVL